MTTVKNCKITGVDISSSPEELAVYSHFGAEPPALCREERLRGLLAFQSAGYFFWRELAGKKVYSVYRQSNPLSLYFNGEQKSDLPAPGWNSGESFQQQLINLVRSTPRAHVHLSDSKDTLGTEQVHLVSESSILLFAGRTSKSFGSEFVNNSQFIGNSIFVSDSKRIVWSVNISRSSKMLFSEDCDECSDSFFLRNCKQCRHCLFSDGLTGEEYFIENQFVGKETFERVIRSLNLDTVEGVEQAKLRDQKVRPTLGASNRPRSFHERGKNSSNLFGVFGAIDCSDIVGYSNSISSSALCVGCGEGATGLFNCVRCFGNVSDLTYCFDCSDSRELFGCAGMSGAEYCILNKQYSEADYLSLKSEIIAALKKKRSWGNLLTLKCSDFPYNGSLAQLIYPLSKVQAQMFEVAWDDEIDNLNLNRLMESPSLLEQISDTPASLEEAQAIPDGVFVCELSGRLFRFLPGELDLYKELNVAPSPYAPEERIRQQWLNAGELAKNA